MKKLLKRFEGNLLFAVSLFLIFFIPLYPKLPLADLLPGYIVRMRLEDLVISGVLILYSYYLIRGRARLFNTPLTKPIAFYLTVGFFSMVSAVFILETVPFENLHIAKMALHYIRRIEYFSLFFVFVSSVNSMKKVRIAIGAILAAAFLVSLYGFGQKYLYWPAFSTMNREFAKGWMLYLTEHARVISTFGGHYDLAAYIMMVLTIGWSVFFALKNNILKAITFAVIAASFWTLILTASRTSFIAYIGAVSFLFFLYAFRKGIGWTLPRWFGVVTLSIVVMLSFGDLSERFTKLLRIDERLSGIKALVFSPFGKPPSDRALFFENNPDQISMITSKSDMPPSIRDQRDRPDDVFEDIPLMIESSESGTISAVRRTYSETAFVYDLSTAIRFDALWPMAIKGFKKNPLLGSGYSTLNKLQASDFTEAESTDNDYLRNLGETGLLGFLTFFGMLLFLIYYIFRNQNAVKDDIVYSFVIGFAALVFGLLINAVYIDVFEASKVAFVFWSFAGISIAAVEINRTKLNGRVLKPYIPDLSLFMRKIRVKLAAFLRTDFFAILLIVILAFSVRLYKIKTPLADWHSWRQADTSAVTRNFVKNGLNPLYPVFDDLSNVPSGMDNLKGYRMVEFPVYNIFSLFIDKLFVGFNIEISGRLANIFSSLFSVVFLYKLVKKHLSKKHAVLSSMAFALLPFNIFYSRVILPEPFMVFTGLGMLYFGDRFAEKSKKNNKGILSKNGISLLKDFIFWVLFGAVSLLAKPYSLFLFFPLSYVYFYHKGYSIRSLAIFALFAVLAFTPLILWRQWILNFPEGIPANTWLLNGDGIRFKGAFFYWIFADRIGRLILGYWGVVFVVGGILSKVKNESKFFYWWLLGMLLYLIVFATGNVRHDYYQIALIPILSVFIAKGIVALWDFARINGRGFIAGPLIVILAVFSLSFSWYHIRDFYNINHPEIVEAGGFVERNTPKDALVIAPYNGDTAFLYQTRRAGWPLVQGSVDELIKKGADYYVSVNYDDLTKELIKEAVPEDLLLRKYKLIEMNDAFVLIQLVPDKDLPR